MHHVQLTDSHDDHTLNWGVNLIAYGERTSCWQKIALNDTKLILV